MVKEEESKEEGELHETATDVVTAPSPPYTDNDQQDLPHNAYIVKGKRTKRQRPQSPVPFTITTQTTQHSSSGGGDDVTNGDLSIIINNNKTNNNIINHKYSSSSSDDHDPNYTTITAEDEYTARCLILLAQGSRNVEPPPRKYDHQDYGVPEKFNSKRYIEAPISGNGKAGMYVYECKTCGRTFPSFQALGGHRASHKKPKNIAAAEEKKMMFINDYLSDEDEEEMTLFKKHKTTNRNSNNNYSSSLSLEFNIGNMGIHKSASFSRIHECSHCGAEFTSGQALGGHMRRHRGAAPVANTTLSLGHSSAEEAVEVHDSDQKNGLSLDLNLPAPEDDHHHHHHNHVKESRFGLPPKQQKNEEKQAAIVLSSATKLVDCRY